VFLCVFFLAGLIFRLLCYVFSLSVVTSWLPVSVLSGLVSEVTYYVSSGIIILLTVAGQKLIQ